MSRTATGPPIFNLKLNLITDSIRSPIFAPVFNPIRNLSEHAGSDPGRDPWRAQGALRKGGSQERPSRTEVAFVLVPPVVVEAGDRCVHVVAVALAPDGRAVEPSRGEQSGPTPRERVKHHAAAKATRPDAAQGNVKGNPA